MQPGPKNLAPTSEVGGTPAASLPEPAQHASPPRVALPERSQHRTPTAVIQRPSQPAPRYPVRPTAAENSEKPNISVIFTSMEWTVPALREAGILATTLGARITLLAPQVVPYPLPLDRPPVLLDWNVKRFHVMAGESAVDTSVRLCLCRDSAETVERALSPKSTVVIGGPNRWWPFTRVKRLARKLRRAGHDVVFTQTE